MQHACNGKKYVGGCLDDILTNILPMNLLHLGPHASVRVQMGPWEHTPPDAPLHHLQACCVSAVATSIAPAALGVREAYWPIYKKYISWIEFETVWVQAAVASPCPGNQWETIYICKQPLSWWDWITYQFQYTNHIYMTKLSLIIASKRFSSSPALRASWFKKSIPWARVSQLHSLDVSVAMGDGFLAIYAKCFSPKLRNVPMHATINDFRFKSN